MEKIAWFAGLIDGEGCFTVSIRKHHKSTLKVTPIFVIQMKNGSWVDEATRILKNIGIKHYARKRRNQIEISVRHWKNVKPLIQVILPFSVVKKPLIEKLFSYNARPKRNRFVPPNQKVVKEIANLVDFVRKFNRGKNRPYKWTGNMVLDFYNSYSGDRNSRNFNPFEPATSRL